MGEWIAYRLLARGPFHMGERGVGMEETSITLRSDTLFSALCLTLREMGEDLEAIFRAFPRARATEEGGLHFEPGAGTSAPFLCSSMFPFAGEVYLFPRPMLRPRGLPYKAAPELAKTLKKVRFVSKPIFEAMLAGRSLHSFVMQAVDDNAQDSLMRKDVFLQNGSVWVSPAELTSLARWRDERSRQVRLWAKTVTPHVTVDRKSNRSQVYGVGRVYFARETGLFFLARYGDDRLRKRVELALRLLGDGGIGGERSSGHGQFDLEIVEPFHLWEAGEEEGGAYCTLSLYWPTRAEVEQGVLADASYLLASRRGWVASPDGMNLRRRSVRMLAAGSVTVQKPTGALVDVKPIDPAPAANVPHDVWRYGMAFPLRCVRDAKKAEE